MPKTTYATIFVDYKGDHGESLTTNYLIEDYDDPNPRKNFAYAKSGSPHKYYCLTLKRAFDAVLEEITLDMADGYVESVYIKVFTNEIAKAKGEKR